MRLFSAALSSLVVLGLAGAATGTPASSGLRGGVTLSPASPVCMEDDACTKPAANVLLLFQRNGRVAARVTTSAAARYRVVLTPGWYTVTAPRYRVGSGVTPRRVRVGAGSLARVDLQIDTGLQ